jgi:hypothetical protein
MSIWKKFIEKKSAEAKRRGFKKMISVFDSTIGQRGGGDDGFYKMIPKLMGVLIIGFIPIIIFNGFIEYFPYICGLLLVLIIILRKQLKAFVSKKINIGGIKENIPNPIQKLKQELVDHKGNYAKGVVISARLEEIPKKDRIKVKGPTKGLKITYIEQIEEIVATVTVQKGKLEIGDALKAHYSIWGWHDCKVSRIYNENGEKVKFAEAGQTVSITGFYKLFSNKNINIDKKPIDGKKFEAYDDSNDPGFE